MGEVVGAGLLAHVPTIVLPESTRRMMRSPSSTETSCSSPPVPCRIPSGRCANYVPTRLRRLSTSSLERLQKPTSSAWSGSPPGTTRGCWRPLPEYYRFKPEARFGHYLMMIGALGEGDCRAKSRQYGEYENSIGTGKCTCGSTVPRKAFRAPRVPTWTPIAEQPSMQGA
jgi:hypothetical protein